MASLLVRFRISPKIAAFVPRASSLNAFSILTSIGVEQIISGIEGTGVANIAVGGIATLAWMLLLTALYLLEIGVAILQAYIFTLLTTVYISLAVSEH